MGWKTPLTLLLLIGVLAGAAYYGWQTIISPATEGDGTSTTSRSHGCTDVQRYKKGDKVMASQTLVNVYNAGGISGLAGETLAIMRNRGFRLGVSDNAPTGVSATNVTVLATDLRAPQVRLVANQFKGKVVYGKTKGRSVGTGISVVVGDRFVGINQKAKRVLVVRKPIRLCTKAKTQDSANS